MTIKIQESDFDVADELRSLHRRNSGYGALVNFVGYVRSDPNEKGHVSSLFLQHYPGMVEKELTAITAEASRRWNLIDYLIIHRVGELLPHEQIVLVATLAQGRKAAFSGAQFIMDWLKTKAPFWKYEVRGGQKYWVAAKDDDDQAADAWNTR